MVTQTQREISLLYQTVLCQCGSWWSQHHSKHHNKMSWPLLEMFASLLNLFHPGSLGAPTLQALACPILFLGLLCPQYCLYCSSHFRTPSIHGRQRMFHKSCYKRKDKNIRPKIWLIMVLIKPGAFDFDNHEVHCKLYWWCLRVARIENFLATAPP